MATWGGGGGRGAGVVVGWGGVVLCFLGVYIWGPIFLGGGPLLRYRRN